MIPGMMPSQSVQPSVSGSRDAVAVAVGYSDKVVVVASGGGAKKLAVNVGKSSDDLRFSVIMAAVSGIISSKADIVGIGIVVDGRM